MKIKLLPILMGISTVLLFTKCSKFEHSEIYPNTEGLMVLGKKLENPYSVSNMQQAYSNLKVTKADIPDFDIETTHLYVRFLPKNMEELELLEDDTTLELSEVPYDYEISEDGYYFHDLTLPIDRPTWLYAAVEEGKALPGIKHEVLSELFLPPDNEELTKSYSDKWIAFFDLLEHEALKITGNLEGDIALKSTKGDSWKPKGRITLWDDITSDYVPIEHVVVKARRWFRTISGITNADGYYECNGYFKRAANYKIAWERYHFSINTNNNRPFDSGGETGGTSDPYAVLFQLSYSLGSKRTVVNGPKKEGDWNFYAQKGSPSHFYGNIFRAAALYYYGDIDGLTRPPLNNTWKTQLKIIAMFRPIPKRDNDYSYEFSEHAVYNPGARSSLDPMWILINNTELNADEAFGMVIRELARATHWNMNRHLYENLESGLIWSWPLGVELFLTRKLYPAYSITYCRYSATGIIEDLTDGFKTTSSNFTGGFYEFEYEEYEDQVSGYTIKQVENALNNAATVKIWKEKLKELYENETENNLDAAFEYWFTY